MLTFLCTTEELELTVPSSSCIMTSSGLLSSITSCMLFTLLLPLPVLTDTLGMEWMLPRLSTSRFRPLPCSPSCREQALRLQNEMPRDQVLTR